MAPDPAAKKRTSAPEDDFVLTLSDNEDPIENGDDAADEETETALASPKKRKRDAEPKGKNKKQKQQQQQLKNGTKKQKKNGSADTEKEADSEGEEEVSEVEDGMDGDGAEDDGVLNPEFEFEFGAAANRGVMEGFDGWGVDADAAGGGNKKAVDIDDIISRRREKKEAESKKKGSKSRKQEESDGEDDSDGGMPVDFEDDELLAEDGFGMGAEDEDESGGSGAEDGSAPGGDDDEEEGDADDAASDNDSIATPVDHPDDAGSDNESEVESEADEEEQEKRKAFFAPEEQVNEQSAADSTKRSFQEYNLSRPILRGLASVGFTNATPIQRKAIPVALLGKDIVGSAVTGSGKTAAFVVPILERLLFRPRKIPTSRVAILMPTRELAVQCYNVATKLAAHTDITFCQLVGGFSLREQENVLKKRPDVIIATPGRFIDHMRNSASFTVDTLEILVLDEADRMLEDGFADELNEILTTIPKSRQTMLFSATMTDSVDKLIRVGLNRPVRLMVDSKKQTSGTLVQEFVRLRPGREGKRLGYLLHLCKEIYTSRSIIFFRQKKEAHRVRVVFGLLGLKAAELHGSMSQEQVCHEPSGLCFSPDADWNKSVSKASRTSEREMWLSSSQLISHLVVWISRVWKLLSTTKHHRATRSIYIESVVPHVPAELVAHVPSPPSQIAR